ncbi:sensor histidine kinase [Baekduia soli]|uniref:Sensor histidine kinase n=1 Tax=Baekduia soli TaxID=496014 RepID=A0A5B8U6R3_9ACTN|nr:ATP-binding protein [Baekduia soli]QEC48783.1 sensor histidine kinase [Baekduia soli]
MASEARGIALLRLALVPAAVLGEASNGPGVSSRLFPWVVGVLAVYAVASLALTFTDYAHDRLSVVQALLDLVMVALLVSTSGGARSPLKYTFYVLPIGAALRLSPKLTATWAGLSVLAYLAVTVRHRDTSLPGDIDLLAGDSVSFLWVGSAAVMLSVLLGRRQRTLSELAATRRALVQQALDAEARERRRLAEELHDHAIQNVLLARQEITDIARGRPGALERARQALDETSRQLRREVFQMHPLGLERAGLTAVLGELAGDAARRGGFEVGVTVDPAAEHGGPQDLLVSTARELLTNVAKHAGARHVTVTVTVGARAVELRLQDDGVGIEPGRLEQAVGQGHIGIAAVIERIRAVDGTVEVHTSPGEGTRIRVRLPINSQAPQREGQG